jgi:hypothetical protein
MRRVSILMKLAVTSSHGSADQREPGVLVFPAISDDMARLVRGQAEPGLMARLQRRLGEFNGRGACRHPDGAVNLVRSALHVFDQDVAAHERGGLCAHRHKPTSLRFPRPISF